MNAKSLIGLIVVTAVVASLATFIVVRNRARMTSDTKAHLVFPALMSHVNRIAEISLRKGTEHLTIVREGDRWLVEQLGGYPARFESVKELIMAAADLRAIEPKASTPALYPRMGVEDPTPETTSTLLTLRDDSGEVAASLIVGNPGPAGSGATTTIFIRKTGEAQSWLAQGRLTSSTDPMTWVSRDILSLDNSRVQSVTITHADGEQVVISRAGSEVSTFSLADIPPGRSLRSAGVLTTAANALGYLPAENIRRAEEFDWSTPDISIAEYRTFDGLLVTVQSQPVDDVQWIRLSASATTPSAALAPGETGDTAREVEELNKIFDGWAYAVSSFKAEQFRKRLEEFLLPPQPPAEAPADPWSEHTTPDRTPSMFGGG